VGELLSNARPGDDDTVGKLLPVVYAELKALAGSFLQGRPGHTLQPTALVHEAYMKLAANDREWAGRDHFIATAAKAMRQVLVDHARGKSAVKRGGGRNRSDVSIETIADGPGAGRARSGAAAREMRVLELDDLLNRLAKDDPRAARVAEMRLFGGMEQEQIARVLGVSRMTITTDWQFARAWLASRYGTGPEASHDA
jgi:RNA polymerase sigma-70 factor, ECF subfamily